MLSRKNFRIGMFPCQAKFLVLVTACVVTSFVDSEPLSAQADLFSPAESNNPQVSIGSAATVVDLSGGKKIEGELVDLDSVDVTTSFGSATFDMSEVEGIKFRAGADGDCIFAFRNGDMVTAKVILDTVKVKTEWGEAHVLPASIESIRLNSSGEFYEDSSVANQKRWRFGVTREVRQSVPTTQINQQPNTFFRQQTNFGG